MYRGTRKNFPRCPADWHRPHHRVADRFKLYVNYPIHEERACHVEKSDSRKGRDIASIFSVLCSFDHCYCSSVARCRLLGRCWQLFSFIWQGHEETEQTEAHS